MDPLDFLEVCKQSTTILNRSTAFPTYQTLADNQIYKKSCFTHEVKFHWVKPKKDKPKVQARECSTTPSIWISRGNEKHEIFVYTRDLSRDNVLRLQDYIFFVE